MNMSQQVPSDVLVQNGTQGWRKRGRVVSENKASEMLFDFGMLTVI